jgi:hypothetical protein
MHAPEKSDPASRKVNYILDADIRDFLDAASYCPRFMRNDQKARAECE